MTPLFTHGITQDAHEFLRPQGYFYKPPVITKAKQRFIDAVASTLRKCLEEEWGTELECFTDLYNSDYFWN